MKSFALVSALQYPAAIAIPAPHNHSFRQLPLRGPEIGRIKIIFQPKLELYFPRGRGRNILKGGQRAGPKSQVAPLLGDHVKHRDEIEGLFAPSAGWGEGVRQERREGMDRYVFVWCVCL